MSTWFTWLGKARVRPNPEVPGDVPPARAVLPVSSYTQSELMGQDLVSIQSVMDVYRLAHVRVELTEENCLLVSPLPPQQVWLKVDAVSQCLVWRMGFELRSERPVLAKLELCNRLSGITGGARFLLVDQSTLMAEYQLSYAHGVLNAQLVSIPLAMQHHVAMALFKLDWDDLVVM